MLEMGQMYTFSVGNVKKFVFFSVFEVVSMFCVISVFVI